MSGNLNVIGPNGYLGKLSVGTGLSGDVIVSNYIGSIDVKSGNLSGDVTAGGSDATVSASSSGSITAPAAKVSSGKTRTARFNAPGGGGGPGGVPAPLAMESCHDTRNK